MNLLGLYMSLIFAPLAALCAYIITYGEYVHHFPTTEEPRKLALEAGIMTLVLFLLIGLFISVALTGIVNQ